MTQQEIDAAVALAKDYAKEEPCIGLVELTVTTLANATVALADEVRRLRGAIIALLVGLDEYWETLPEGIEAKRKASEALGEKQDE